MSGKTLHQVFPNWQTDVIEPPGRRTALVAIAWVMLIGGAVADVATTWYGLQIGLNESNPIARGVLDGYGAIGMVALKGVTVGYVTLAFAVVGPRFQRIRIPMVAIPGMLWLGAATTNLWLILVIA